MRENALVYGLPIGAWHCWPTTIRRARTSSSPAITTNVSRDLEQPAR
jgi:hypothetical protein